MTLCINLITKNNRIKKLEDHQFFHDSTESRVSKLFDEFVALEGAALDGDESERG